MTWSLNYLQAAVMHHFITICTSLNFEIWNEKIHIRLNFIYIIMLNGSTKHPLQKKKN